MATSDGLLRDQNMCHLRAPNAPIYPITPKGSIGMAQNIVSWLKAGAFAAFAPRLQHQHAADIAPLSQSLTHWMFQGLAWFGLRASWDVSLPTQRATGSFAVPLPFPPACAIGTPPPSTRRE